MAELFSAPFAPPSCPRCSSKMLSETDDTMSFLCGTELLLDDREGGWVHDWSEDANQVCQHISQLREQITQLEVGEANLVEELDKAKRAATDAKRRLNNTHIGTMLRVHEQAHTALAFASSVIKAGEPWTDTCEEVIGGALTALKPTR